ncbi:PLP-dependent aminotransferase family protein [Litoribacillus peritrichatus]|uniref:PLP-dependent aminotransferase family protein n=2 Tax=Litoribacillus peritrichatus TaxID=718191 RepID=A0ABP7MU48_9GAMM
MSVSRNTVNAALDQLKSEGYLESKPGSGCFISEHLPETYLTAQKVSRSSAGEHSLERVNKQHRRLQLSAFSQALGAVPIKQQVENGSFEAGVPDLKAFPTKRWAQIIHHQSQRSSLMGYDNPQGYLPLREVLADYLRTSRGVDCNACEIVITAGAQQASNLALQVLLDQGDSVYVEDPGYIGFRKAVQANGGQVIGLPVSSQGLDLDFLPKAPSGKVMYITPTHQYPMGGIMPLGNRMKLLQWAADHGVWVLEDDYDSEYHYEHKPIAAIQGLGLKEQVLYIGSFSKVMFPGLRLGYLVVPERLVDACVKAKNFMSGHSPILEQAATAEFIQSGLFIRHLRQMRVLYQDKHNEMLRACKTHLADFMTAIYTGAGMHLVLVFKGALQDNHTSDVKVVEAMALRGIQGGALSSYYVEKHRENGLVLGFSNTNVADIERGVLRIRQAVEACLDH